MLDKGNSLPLEERMKLFLALVDAQDGHMTVAQSRQAVAKQFGVSEQQVRQVEREGLDGDWPPWGNAGRLASPMARQQEATGQARGLP